MKTFELDIAGETSKHGIPTDAWSQEDVRDFNDLKYKDVIFDTVVGKELPEEFLGVKARKVVELRNSNQATFIDKDYTLQSSWHDGVVISVPERDKDMAFIITSDYKGSMGWCANYQTSTSFDFRGYFMTPDNDTKDVDGYNFSDVIKGYTPITNIQLRDLATAQNMNVNVYAFPISELLM